MPQAAFSAALAFTLVLASAAGLAAQPQPAPAIDPERPFGDLDLTRWELAQYLSGTQKDDARILFLRGLDEGARADLLARCRVIEAGPARFGADVLELCGMADGVLVSPAP